MPTALTRAIEQPQHPLKIVYLTDVELADLLRVSVSTVRRWRLLSQGPPWIKCEGAVRYSLHCVIDWCTANQRGTPR